MKNIYQLGEFLRTKRQAKGFSLKDVEDQIDVSASYLNRLEKGNRQNPSMSVLEKLSRFYEIDPKVIMQLAGFECEQEGSDIIDVMVMNHICIDGIDVPVNEFKEVLSAVMSVNTSDFISIADLANKIKRLQALITTSQTLGA